MSGFEKQSLCVRVFRLDGRTETRARLIDHALFHETLVLIVEIVL